MIDTSQGVGYSVGDGAAVTQTASKTNFVTINKLTGTITMHNTVMGAGTTVIFGVSNNQFKATDVVVVNPFAMATNGTYQVAVDNANTTDGTFYISVKNISAGSLSEALKIRFAVIKGASS